MDTLRIRAGQVEPFIKATIDTFKTMVNLKVIRGEIRLRQAGVVTNDVSGTIGLFGAAEGSVTLGFSKGTAQAVADSFLGETDVSSVLMKDSIGELVNIIAGFAKKDFPDVDVNITLPSVIVGDGHEISSHADDRKVVAYFTCPLGEFHLEVYLEGLPEKTQPSAIGEK